MTYVTAAITVFGIFSSNRNAKKNRRLADTQASTQLAFQKEQQALLEVQKQKYREFEFKNPYADMVNPFSGMENTMEDLTVSQEAARFQMEQGAQQRTNIMAQLRGAAGGSGIAALAQSLANQGTLQARQVSADISQQEQRNQMASAQGAMQVQQMEATGQSAVDMARMGGEAMVQEAEARRQATLLGVAYQGAAGAAGGVQQAYANQMQMGMMQSQIQMQNLNALGQIDFSNINFGGGGGNTGGGLTDTQTNYVMGDFGDGTVIS